MHGIAAACGELGIIVTQISFFRDVLREHIAKGDMSIHSLFFLRLTGIGSTCLPLPDETA
jgi:hypothetical protein